MSTIATDLRVRFPRASWRDCTRQLRQLLIEGAIVGAAMLSEMPFLDHLEELRRRLIKCVIALSVGTILGLTYAAQLIEFLGKPVANSGIPLVAIDATEIFSIYF